MKSTTEKSDNADSTMHIQAVLRDTLVLDPLLETESLHG
jgi:hypothetical protein